MAANGQPPAAATTIDDLPEGLLLDIFLRLPSLSDLVRAARTCLAWRNLVTNFPLFRRQFIDLHPAPLLGLFFDTPFQFVPGIPAFAPARRNDPELVAAILSGDFFLTTLQARDGPEANWSFLDACGGYLLVLQEDEILLALLNPLARWGGRFFDLRDSHIFDDDDDREGDRRLVYGGLICDDENPTSFRIFCLASHGEFRLRAAVFFSFLGMGGNWFLSPWLDVPHHPHGLSLDNGMRVGNFIYWPYLDRSYVVVLDPDPYNPRLFVEMIPPLLNLDGFHSSILGQINGDNMCIAYSYGFNIGSMRRQEDGLDAGAWTNSGVFNLADAVERKLGQLPENGLEIAAMRGSIVYFTTLEMFHPLKDACWFACLCLESGRLEWLFPRTYNGFFQPYHHPSWSTFLLPENERFYPFI
ncbi:hypothetical protein D1007_37878 [Hordeum vulgare]|uniref:F-box domain-containing protein n=1 Tax=Hordeum vulgare subsp. vulgare TaxID=112509 RepID=A0A8I6X515_HORVV|nr:uncharacterized protein LOC123439755 [Hordeum vulgare subsp. vulgare]KAE8788094.1 hypothetical protein D1007_37878 [Hordeum vulgare]KAI5006458.1 hypothetical protein ZWY2020_033701 [Hordeum vulgare]